MRLALLASLLALALAGCIEAETEPPETSDIVAGVPWPDNERAEYVLLNRDSKAEIGSGVLTIARDGDRYELGLNFQNEDATDESAIVVDASTLKPISVRREFRSEDFAILEAEYDDDAEVVNITEIDKDGDERLVPLRLEEHYYDNESSLFVWRTIAFAEGYEADYYSVLTNFRRNNLVHIEVVEQEEITVPAGTFQTWRVVISFENVEQVAWFSTGPDRALVQYDNSLQLFQLTSVTEG